MRAGELRHKVRIEEPIETQNELGEPERSWSTVTELWAKKEDLAGREYFAAQETQSEVTTRFRARYRAGIEPQMRLICAGIPYDIDSVQDPDGRRREMVIMVRRGTA